MPRDQFLIAPLNKGQQTRLKAWLLPNEAFEILENVYVWRGRLRKRIGADNMNETTSLEGRPLLSRLRYNIGTVAAHALPAGANQIQPGQIFSVGDDIFTVTAIGAGVATLSTNTGATGTVNTAVNPNTIAFTGEAAGSTVYWYPSLPVMALATYDSQNVNNEVLIAFDTQFAYLFTYATGWNVINAGVAAAVWTGSDSDFYWTANYQGTSSSNFLMFVTNNTATDAMRYYDGTNFNAWGSAGTTDINATPDYIVTCKLIFAFKGRLLLFNTLEHTAAGNTRYINRMRWCGAGTPIQGGGALPWYEYPAASNRGGYSDAATKEAIVSGQFLKDRLIIYFERSTWEVVYTGSAANPFVWQRINAELGAESMNSVIGFDKVVLGFGQTGIHACNGINVERIDEDIPSEIYDVTNDNNGPERVNGIRDYYNELVYWSYNSPSIQTGHNETFPNSMLVYDYIGDTWSKWDDSITAFGNYQYQKNLTWADISDPWDSLHSTWAGLALRDRFLSVVAGNQNGWTFVLREGTLTQAGSMVITDIAIASNIITFTCFDHNLQNNSFIQLYGIQIDDPLDDLTFLNGRIVQVTTTSDDAFTIDTEELFEMELTGTYTGGGWYRTVPEPYILTKQYNFYLPQGQQMAINQVDFYVEKTNNGIFQVDYFTSASNRSLVEDADTSGAAVGTSVVETSPYTLVPLESSQSRFWHSIYFDAQGEVIQLAIYITDEQILQEVVVGDAFTYPILQDLQIHAINFHANRTNNIGP